MFYLMCSQNFICVMCCVYILYKHKGFLFLSEFFGLSWQCVGTHIDPQGLVFMSFQHYVLYIANIVCDFQTILTINRYIIVTFRKTQVLRSVKHYKNLLKPCIYCISKLCIISHNSIMCSPVQLCWNCLSFSHNQMCQVLAILQRLMCSFACCCRLYTDQPNHIDDSGPQ